MNLKKILIRWLPLALAISMILVTVEIVVQQNYRISANDPQIQVSEDIATNFKDTKDATNLVPSEKTDISKSLATFGIIYDKNGGLLASSANLDNQTPSLPKGVIDDTNKHHQSRFTWQPKSGVRLAAVIAKADGGYVLVGRNLREVEVRERNLDISILIAWVGTLLATFAAFWILNFYENKKPSKKTVKAL
jgi:hypothetical protein